MAKVPAFAKAFAGRWRIIEMDVWDMFGRVMEGGSDRQRLDDGRSVRRPFPPDLSRASSILCLALSPSMLSKFTAALPPASLTTVYSAWRSRSSACPMH